MGCALGKSTDAGERRRHNTATAGGGNNVGRVRERQKPPLAGELSGVIPAPERRRPRLNSFTATHQGWPPWLMAVAGDAIGDWTPRRANTFEKLAKFFTTEPYASEPSSLPKYPPTKELDVKLRDEEARRQKALSAKTSAVDGVRRVRVRERALAIPAPEANAEIQTNLDVCQMFP
ncbi:serine/threonine-protein kinase [Spatholobus suberectus]|nr:serine/threonine-protein kinase [Spatholobus suberectus]